MKKTIQGGIVNLTNIKQQQLQEEYDNLQEYLHTDEDVELYSANRQQADRHYDTIKDGKEYPISIRKDLIEARKCESSTADYFIRVPTAQRWGGVKVPVKTHTPIPDDAELCESKLYRKDGQFYINIVVSIEEPEQVEADGIIGIDLGLKRPVTGVTWSVAEEKVQDVFFKGDTIQQTQSRYAYLRRQSSTGKNWGKKEYDKVEDEIHKITTAIAEQADEQDMAVAVGDLEGIQNQDCGREMNRKLHRFPHHTFRRLLEYKCRERGVQYVEVDEAYTSQTCYKCGQKGDLTSDHLHCGGSKMNRDVNAAANISKRAATKVETNPLEAAGAA